MIYCSKNEHNRHVFTSKNSIAKSPTPGFEPDQAREVAAMRYIIKKKKKRWYTERKQLHNTDPYGQWTTSQSDGS